MDGGRGAQSQLSGVTPGTDTRVARCLSSECVGDAYAHGARLLVERHLLPFAAGKRIGQRSRIRQVRDPETGVPVRGGILDSDPSAELILVKVALSFVPTVVSVAMITTEISAAMSPYSIAVAPLSSFAKRAKTFFMIQTPLASPCDRGQ